MTDKVNRVQASEWYKKQGHELVCLITSWNKSNEEIRKLFFYIIFTKAQGNNEVPHLY